MRRSKAGWKREDIDTLYLGFGFIITPGKSHDIVKHPDFPQLRDVLPRHKFIAKGYVNDAIKLIEELERLKKDQERQQSE
jgi:hypothetical protein